jgi:hypothetical protein
MQSKLISRLGFLGIISFLSYLSAVLFSPLAYPGYNWLAQAVSDLSANNAPSKVLWGQISVLYPVCALICLSLACVFIQGRLTKVLRVGVYSFTLMHVFSYVGYSWFPLTDSGYAGTFQDVMHMVVTAAVVLLSIVSLVLLIVGGLKNRKYLFMAIGASITLALMIGGPIGIAMAPKEMFGFFERFSTLSAAAFTMFLGICLMIKFKEE